MTSPSHGAEPSSSREAAHVHADQECCRQAPDNHVAECLSPVNVPESILLSENYLLPSPSSGHELLFSKTESKGKSRAISTLPQTLEQLMNVSTASSELFSPIDTPSDTASECASEGSSSIPGPDSESLDVLGSAGLTNLSLRELEIELDMREARLLEKNGGKALTGSNSVSTRMKSSIDREVEILQALHQAKLVAQLEVQDKSRAHHKIERQSQKGKEEASDLPTHRPLAGAQVSSSELTVSGKGSWKQVDAYVYQPQKPFTGPAKGARRAEAQSEEIALRDQKPVLHASSPKEVLPTGSASKIDPTRSRPQSQLSSGAPGAGHMKEPTYLVSTGSREVVHFPNLGPDLPIVHFTKGWLDEVVLVMMNWIHVPISSLRTIAKIASLLETKVAYLVCTDPYHVPTTFRTVLNTHDDAARLDIGESPNQVRATKKAIKAAQSLSNPGGAGLVREWTTIARAWQAKLLKWRYDLSCPSLKAFVQAKTGCCTAYVRLIKDLFQAEEVDSSIPRDFDPQFTTFCDGIGRLMALYNGHSFARLQTDLHHSTVSYAVVHCHERNPRLGEKALQLLNQQRGEVFARNSHPVGRSPICHQLIAVLHATGSLNVQSEAAMEALKDVRDSQSFLEHELGLSKGLTRQWLDHYDRLLRADSESAEESALYLHRQDGPEASDP